MYHYLNHIWYYLELGLNPAEGKGDFMKKEKKHSKQNYFTPSPDAYNMRGALPKTEKPRTSPAP
jgi:hypothetical protein